MEIEAIGRQTSTSALTANNSISQDEFIELFLAQLSFQDPLEPMDNSEFLAQLAQFSSVQQISENGQTLDSIAYINSAAQGTSILGKNVEIRTETGVQGGEVTGINFSNEGLRLTLRLADGSVLTNVSYSQVIQVTNN